MQEGNEVPAQPAPRRGINQFDARICQFTQGGLQMGDSECHMMHARALLCEESGNSSVVCHRGDELHIRRAIAQEHCLDALFGHHLAYTHRHSERVPVDRDLRVEVGHDVADMVDEAQLHAADGNGLLPRNQRNGHKARVRLLAAAHLGAGAAVHPHDVAGEVV